MKDDAVDRQRRIENIVERRLRVSTTQYTEKEGFTIQRCPTLNN
jgi:hypothetical protein